MSEKTDSLYITTPIYYINDVPHVGHAYTTTVCDALARYARMRGRDVRFQTGTDEHGEKAAQRAEGQGIKPQELADKNVERYKEAWKTLGMSHDSFIRTTDAAHVAGAQDFWRRIAESGDLYKANYEGPYCVGCEAFFTEAQLVDGCCPEDSDHVIETLSEECYYFRLSSYQERLLNHYAAHPEFVRPETRRNEVVSFVEMGLQDICVSRTRFDWGVPVPGEPDHVMYVWIDALSNYITGLGLGADESLLDRHWPGQHVVGKDILRFHAVYWPAYLMAAGLPLPQQVLCHGFWNMDGKKMSKTRGNVADPIQLVDWFGRDAVRYFLLREITLGADGNYSEEALIERANTDLANDLGNTLQRVTKLITDHLEGVVPTGDGSLKEAGGKAWEAYVTNMDAQKPQAGLKAAWELVAATNKLLMDEAPWKLAKDPSKRARFEGVMAEAAEALRHVALMAAPAMPDSAAEIWRRLGLSEDPNALSFKVLFDGEQGLTWGFPREASPVILGDPLFPRIDKKAFFAGQQPKESESQDQKPKKAKKEKKAKPLPEGCIDINDFLKVELRSAVVKSCEKHPDADRLLVLTLDDGSGTERTICAGLAAHHDASELRGKTLAIVSNLVPRKLRGIPSQGMVLATSWTEGTEERVQAVILADGVPPGATIG